MEYWQKVCISCVSWNIGPAYPILRDVYNYHLLLCGYGIFMNICPPYPRVTEKEREENERERGREM